MKAELRQAAGVLIVDQQRVLLVRHNYGLRRWSFPGGVVEAGETPAAAARREALEEIGVAVRLGGLQGRYRVHGLGRPDIDVHIFTASLISGDIRIADPAEIADLGWFHPAAPPNPLTTDARGVFEDMVHGRTGVKRAIERLL